MDNLPALIIAVGSLITAMASAAAVVIGAFNSIKLSRTAQQVEKIEVATNSMKDALVAATAKGEHAAGVAQGRADMKAELAISAVKGIQ